MLNIASLIADEVARTAEWRWLQAERFPQDAGRNLEASEILERIADGLQQLHGIEWHWRLQGICNRNPERFSEILSQHTRSVGFRSTARNAAEFLEELFFLLESFESDSNGQIIPLGGRR
jgi:aminoglycoside phosphotransferase (APT) family kinase protein